MYTWDIALDWLLVCVCVWCAGKPQQFTLNFRPSRNFPLDVYFLLDVTGSFSQRFRDTVTPLATELGLSLYLLTGPSDSLTLPSSLYTSTTVLGSLSLSLFYPQSLLCLPSISSLCLVHNMSHWLVAPCCIAAPWGRLHFYLRGRTQCGTVRQGNAPYCEPSLTLLLFSHPIISLSLYSPSFSSSPCLTSYCTLPHLIPLSFP